MKSIFKGKYFDLLHDDSRDDSIVDEIVSGRMEFFDLFLKAEYDKHIKPDHVVVEVGAHVGTHTCYLSKLARKVTAFEPQPILYRRLVANLYLNDCANVEVINAACYNEKCDMKARIKGEAEYIASHEKASISFGFAPPGGGFLVVPAVKLDDVITGPVHFIKIDAEETDLNVALGAVVLIERYRPVIAFEDNAKHMDRWQALLAPFRYAIREISGPSNYIAEPQP